MNNIKNWNILLFFWLTSLCKSSSSLRINWVSWLLNSAINLAITCIGLWGGAGFHFRFTNSEIWRTRKLLEIGILFKYHHWYTIVLPCLQLNTKLKLYNFLNSSHFVTYNVVSGLWQLCMIILVFSYEVLLFKKSSSRRSRR